MMFDMKLDPTTLHRDLYISTDNKVLSSHYTTDTSNKLRGKNQPKNYHGVVADVCVEDGRIIYYTVAYHYKITSDVGGRQHILELGVVERDEDGAYRYDGGSSVSGMFFNLANCEFEICLYAEHNSHEKLEIPFSNNRAGTTMKGKFSVSINRVRNEVSLINDNKIIYTFKDFKSDMKLCPVFAVYSPDQVETKLHLTSSYNFTNLPLLY